jgi:hypothetical protein
MTNVDTTHVVPHNLAHNNGELSMGQHVIEGAAVQGVDPEELLVTIRDEQHQKR